MSRFSYVYLLVSDLVVWILIGIACGLVVFSIASYGLSYSGSMVCMGFCGIELSYSDVVEPTLVFLSRRFESICLLLLPITAMLGVYVVAFEHEYGYSLFSLFTGFSRFRYHVVRILGTLALYSIALFFSVILSLWLVDRYLLAIPIVVAFLYVSTLFIVAIHYMVAVIVSIVSRSSFRALALSLAALFILYSIGIPWRYVTVIGTEEVSLSTFSVLLTEFSIVVALCISILVLICRKLSLR